MPAGSRGCPAEALAPWQGHEAEPLPSVALETSPCPGSQPWCCAWSLPVARALRHGGRGDPRGQGSLSQLPAGFGTQGRAGEGSGGCCLVLWRVLSCPHCSWVASRFLLQAGGTWSGDPWPTSTRAHGPEGAAKLRGAPTPCLSPPELECFLCCWMLLGYSELIDQQPKKVVWDFFFSALDWLEGGLDVQDAPTAMQTSANF